MKVLASPENKLNFTEKDLSQLIGLYHIGIINASDDPVLTAIVLDAINKQNEKKQIKTKLTLKQKILKYFIITILLMIGLSIPLTLYFLTSELFLLEMIWGIKINSYFFLKEKKNLLMKTFIAIIMREAMKWLK